MRIIGSDYDGTLTYGGIDQCKRDAIAAWQAAGNCFALVSGRGAADLRTIRREHQLTLDYYIGCNGGLILGRDENLIWGTEFEANAADYLRRMQELGCPVAYINTLDHQYKIRLKGAFQQEDEILLHQLPQIDHFFQLSVRMETLEAAKAVKEQILALYGEEMIPLQNNRILDIVPPGVNKAAGLRRLAFLLGCKDTDVIAVGDNINDVDMLTTFRSYAMESGVEAAKAAAKFRTPGISELIALEMAGCINI